jgi:hypothetical protein
MSQRWLKLLERIGAPHLRASAGSAEVQFRNVRDGVWHEFCDYEVLFRLYGPPPESPWYPYHCPTLFAAIDRLNLGPRPIQMSPEVALRGPAGAFAWLERGAMAVLDLPGGLAVQLGARLMLEAGVQLVSTFDHWPLANPVRPGPAPENLEPRPWPPQDTLRSVAIDSRDVIDSMVSLAPQVYRRWQQGLAVDAPPVWLCDMRRMSAVRPGPGDFDNRYFIDDSLLPSAALLRQHGIERLVYVRYGFPSQPSADLARFLRECHDAGIALRSAVLVEPTSWAEPMPMAPPPAIPLAGRKFPKSQIGGFGRRIPEPSESSGGSFSGAGG